jgi:hypothetical protein
VEPFDLIWAGIRMLPSQAGVSYRDARFEGAECCRQAVPHHFRIVGRHEAMVATGGLVAGTEDAGREVPAGVLSSTRRTKSYIPGVVVPALALASAS